jgi:hypothetical protein
MHVIKEALSHLLVSIVLVDTIVKQAQRHKSLAVIKLEDHNTTMVVYVNQVTLVLNVPQLKLNVLLVIIAKIMV